MNEVNAGAFAATCGLLCVWPLVFGFVGYLIGRGRLRFHRPVSFGPADYGDE